MSLYLTVLTKWHIIEKYFLHFQGTSLEFADLEKEQNETSSNTVTNRNSTLSSSAQPLSTTTSPVPEMKFNLEMSTRLSNTTQYSSTQTQIAENTTDLMNNSSNVSSTKNVDMVATETSENKTVLSSTLPANNGSSTVQLTNGTKPVSTTESMKQTMAMSEVNTVEEDKVTSYVEMNKTSIENNTNILKTESLGFSCPACPTAPTCPMCESSCSVTPTTPIPTATKIEPGTFVYVLISKLHRVEYYVILIFVIYVIFKCGLGDKMTYYTKVLINKINTKLVISLKEWF